MNTLLPPTLSSVNVSRKEYRFVLMIVLALFLITGLPYLYAVLTVPDDKQFMGFILNIADHAQYLSWYKAFQTSFLISNKMTSDANPAVFFNLLWWLMAQTGNLTGLGYAWVFQIMRFSFCFCFLSDGLLVYSPGVFRSSS